MTLDPMVFSLDDSDEEGRPKLLEGARDFILKMASEYSQFGGFSRIYITGSILSYQWTDYSDIDVHMEMTEGNVEAAIKKATQEAEYVLLPGTKHPVNFYIGTDLSSDFAQADGVYDLVRDKWIRGPYNISANLERYMQEFQSVASRIDVVRGSLKRNIVDLEGLYSLSDKDIKNLTSLVKEKLREINQAVSELSNTYSVYRTMRSLGFAKGLSPSEAQDAVSRQLLPTNVVFKLLEKYHYVSLLKNVRKLLIQSGGRIGIKQIKDLKQAVSQESIQ